MNFKLVRSTAFFGLLLPFLYLGTASATFLYRVHAGNSARAQIHLPVLPAPTASRRIVVFAPHCDDEMLGCGGFLQQAVKSGAEVKVVMITNGDGFRVAVERQFRSLHVGPSDYIRFAGVRQNESYRALEKLGVKRADVAFLGYPDRGLGALWTDNWSQDHPYTSLYTGSSRSPYAVAYHPGAVYCGQELLNDITSVLRETRPTDVLVTHPSDDHPDHTAASAFVALALKRLRNENAGWVKSCSLRYYLVHRGDWPVPQGLQKTDHLVPPSEMASLDTHWEERPLTVGEVAQKEQGILSYPSQTAVMKRFLVSFARQNEIFGRLDEAEVPRVADGTIDLTGRLGNWHKLKPAILDPINDNLLRDFQAGGDIKEVYACRDSKWLCLLVETNQPISRRIEFKVQIRYFGDDKRPTSSGMYRATIKANSAQAPTDLKFASASNRLEVAIPLNDLHNSRDVALDVATSFAGFQVDRTGYRFLHIDD